MPFQFNIGCGPAQYVVDDECRDRDEIDSAENGIFIYKHQGDDAGDNHYEHVPVVDAARIYVPGVALSVDYVVDSFSCHVLELWSSELFCHTVYRSAFQLILKDLIDIRRAFYIHPGFSFT